MNTVDNQAPMKTLTAQFMRKMKRSGLNSAQFLRKMTIDHFTLQNVETPEENAGMPNFYEKGI